MFVNLSYAWIQIFMNLWTWILPWYFCRFCRLCRNKKVFFVVLSQQNFIRQIAHVYLLYATDSGHFLFSFTWETQWLTVLLLSSLTRVGQHHQSELLELSKTRARLAIIARLAFYSSLDSSQVGKSAFEVFEALKTAE